MLRSLFSVLVALNMLAGATLAGFFGHMGYQGEPERLTRQINPDLIRLSPPQPGSSMEAAPEPAGIAAVAAVSKIAEAPPIVTPPPLPPENTIPGSPSPPSPADTEPSPLTPPNPSPVMPAPLPVAAPEPVPPKPPVSAAQPPDPPRCARFTRLSPDEANALLTKAQKSVPAVRIENTTSEVIRDWWVHIPTAKNRPEADQKVSQLRQLGIQDHFVVREAGPTQFYVSLGVFKTETAARRYLGSVQRRGVKEVIVIPRRITNHAITLRAPEKELMPFVQKVAAQASPPFEWERCR
jgi:hypothetical protein